MLSRIAIRAFVARALLLTTVASVGIARPAVAAESGDVGATVRASVVIVSAHLSDHRDTVGAGVVVAMTRYGVRVLTAGHVVRDGPVTVWIDRHPYDATITRTFAHRDLALLDALVDRSDLRAVRPAPLGGTADVGMPLAVWGENEAGLRLVPATLVSTAYTSISDSDAPPLVAIACEACDRGDSGGGIFAADGTLLGILVARYVTRDRRVVAIVGERVDASLLAGDRDLAESR